MLTCSLYRSLIRLFIVTISSLGIIACSTSNEALSVDKFTLRSIQIEDNDVAMVRGDQQKRLYGAVTIEEHQQRIGQYYNLRWCLLNETTLKNKDLNSPVQLIFRYQQASTGSKIITARKTYPKGTKQDTWTFKNIGSDYAEAGRILSWRAELLYDGQIISSKESYLWSK